MASAILDIKLSNLECIVKTSSLGVLLQSVQRGFLFNINQTQFYAHSFKTGSDEASMPFSVLTDDFQAITATLEGAEQLQKKTSNLPHSLKL